MGLFLFESALVATTLVAEPMIVLFVWIGSYLALIKRADDEIFFIFCGALCATLFGKNLNWKPKSEDTIRNLLEAFILTFLTLYVMPVLGADGFVRTAGACALYFFATQKWEIPALILFLFVAFQFEDPLGVVILTTSLLGLIFYVKNKLLK